MIWLPLINTTKKNGTLIVKPESQNENNVSYFKEKKGDKFSSRQLVIKNKFLKKYKTESVNVKRNSALVSYSGLFHKSGNNSSDTVKFVFIARFNKILSKDFTSQDYIALSRSQKRALIYLIKIRDCKIIANDSFSLKAFPFYSDKDIFDNFVKQYYLTNIDKPDFIYSMIESDIKKNIFDIKIKIPKTLI